MIICKIFRMRSIFVIDRRVDRFGLGETIKGAVMTSVTAVKPPLGPRGIINTEILWVGTRKNGGFSDDSDDDDDLCH